MVTLIGTYPPIRCGIATFNRDLRRALLGAGLEAKVAVVADTPDLALPFPREVAWVLPKAKREAYRRLPAPTPWILQHEYGLYGGEWGAWFLDLLEGRGPKVVVLHTLLQGVPPGLTQEDFALMQGILREIGQKAQALVSLHPEGPAYLEGLGLGGKAVYIPHGVPDLPRPDKEALKRALGLEGHFLLLTYGLLSPGKGLELVIRALPQVLAHRPEVRYLVAGSLHPNVERREGRRYIEALLALAEALGVRKALILREGYLRDEELYRLVGAADLLLLPYPNLEQVSSGTLSYALALGKAILATPFWHARQALAGGRGLLLPQDPGAWAKAILFLAESPTRLRAMEEAAYAYARSATWPRVARAYLDLLREVGDVRSFVA